MPAPSKGPRLIWIDAQQSSRIPCQGDVHIETVQLDITGPDARIEVEADLLYCEDEDRWFAPLLLLEDLLVELRWAFEDVIGFTIDDEPVKSGVWLEDTEEPAPWAAYAAARSHLGPPSEAPVPAEDDVAALAVLPRSWEVGAREAHEVYDDTGQRMPSFVALVVEAETQFVRQVDVKSGQQHTVEELATLLLKAAVQGEAGRPNRVRVAEPGLAEALANRLQKAGIPVEAGATSLLDAILDDLLAELKPEAPPLAFEGWEDEELRSFMKSARLFYKQRPWERFDGRKYVAFRIDDGPWGYLSVLGQMGEEFGLSYFMNWLQICRFVHGRPTLFEAMMELETGESGQFAAAGWMEGVMLEESLDLHPDDLNRLTALKLKPFRGRHYPVPRHFSPDGIGPLRLPPGYYAALMEAIAVVVGRRSAPLITSIKKTIQVGDMEVVLRYPARGDEGHSGRLPGCRLVVYGAASELLDNPLPPGWRIEVDAPGETPFHRVVAAIKKEGEDFTAFWVNGLRMDDTYVWTDQNGRSGPSPILADLANRRNLMMEVYMQPFPMQVMESVGRAPDEVQVRVREGGRP